MVVAVDRVVVAADPVADRVAKVVVLVVPADKVVVPAVVVVDLVAVRVVAVARVVLPA